MANSHGGGKPGSGRVVRMPERRFPVGLVVAGGLVLAVLIALVVVIFLDVNQRAASSEPQGTENVDVGNTRQHTTTTVNYNQTPPAGGNHDPAWQNCGSYTEPVRNENVVHSLEHGAVWISFKPNLPEGQQNTIRDIARGQTYVLASPVEDQPSPVVATAWGKQLQFQNADDPKLEQFVRAFRQGPQTPEPGATCAGGIGTPS